MLNVIRQWAAGGTLAHVSSPVQFNSISEIAQKLLAPVGGIAMIIAVVLVIYGGFTYMTSAGDSNKIGKAMKIIQSALVGLAIVLLAFVLVDFFKSIIS